MKQKILDALKTKFTGVQDAILNRIAEKLAKTVSTDEEVTTKVEGVTFQEVLTSYGDSRATEASKTAVATYEKQHKLKDGKPVEESDVDKNDPKDGDDDVPKWAKALIEQNKALEERLNNADKANITNSRKKQFEEAISKLPDNLKKVYGRTAYDTMTDDDFTTLMGEVKTEVEGFEAESKQRGGVFGSPSRSGRQTTQKPTDEQAKAVVDAMHL